MCNRSFDNVEKAFLARLTIGQAAVIMIGVFCRDRDCKEGISHKEEAFII